MGAVIATIATIIIVGGVAAGVYFFVIKKKTDERKDEYESKISDLETDIKTLQAKIIELNSDIDGMGEDKQDLNDKIKTLTADLNAKITKIKNFRGNYAWQSGSVCKEYEDRKTALEGLTDVDNIKKIEDKYKIKFRGCFLDDPTSKDNRVMVSANYPGKDEEGGDSLLKKCINIAKGKYRYIGIQNINGRPLCMMTENYWKATSKGYAPANKCLRTSIEKAPAGYINVNAVYNLEPLVKDSKGRTEEERCA